MHVHTSANRIVAARQAQARQMPQGAASSTHPPKQRRQPPWRIAGPDVAMRTTQPRKHSTGCAWRTSPLRMSWSPVGPLFLGFASAVSLLRALRSVWGGNVLQIVLGCCVGFGVVSGARPCTAMLRDAAPTEGSGPTAICYVGSWTCSNAIPRVWRGSATARTQTVASQGARLPSGDRKQVRHITLSPTTAGLTGRAFVSMAARRLQV